MSAIAHIVQPPQPAPCWPAEQVRRHSIEVPEDTKRSQPPRAVPVEPKPPKAAPVKAAPVKAKPARARKPRKMAGLSPRQAQALELLAESGCAKLATATKRLGTTTRWETIMAWKDAQC
jgi:hypothetical protein